jgi:tetratricopeptide (TPR) repeat protein
MSEHPQTIGPYRVLRRLGAGGMGEVLLADDERLDRGVAIKRIRPDAGTAPGRRERFRREARLAARLNHPAIVQVYDILTEGDLEYIVMEYVEGRNLYELIESGPLEVSFVLALARQLADGLDAAHRQNIVHRDFKAENVLVTPAGQAKITDFGIAKQLLVPADGPLTRNNAVLGTCRVMSPEQARGEPVDHRTDLFAFGVLLYEALTGVSPFDAENSLATLHRVIHHRQTPVLSHNAAVPEGLSGLVDKLLEKDPFLRPQSAGQVKRALAALAAGGTGPGFGDTTTAHATLAEPLPPPRIPAAPRTTALTALRARPRLAALLLAGLAALLAAGGWLALRHRREPLYVAVMPPELSAGSAGASGGELDLLAAAVRVALLRQLAGLEGISARESEEAGEAAASPVQAARAAGTDEVVRSRLDCRAETCSVSLSRVRGADGGVICPLTFQVPTDDFSLAASAVANQIRQCYPELRTRRGIPDQRVGSRDLQQFLELRRQWSARADLGPLLASLEALRGRSPGFVDAYLLEADVARRRFFFSRDPQDLERAFQRIREAREIAPGDPRPLLKLASANLVAGRLDKAAEALDELQRLTPGDVQVLDNRAQLLSARGQPEEGLALLRSAAARHPSARRLYNLATMEYQQGQIAAARRHLAASLQRSPGYPDSLSLLAQLELANGDVRRAVAIYSDFVRRSPGEAELTNLGLAWFTLGRYPEAAERFRQALAQKPRNPVYVLNLADALLLMARRAEADDLYRRVIELCASDPSGAADPQLLTVRAQALAHLGQGRPAVAAVQEALRLAPRNGQTAWEAALVYALLGEDDSALVNTEKALALGVQPRWFTFPWFAALRAHPEFQTLLRDAPPAAH